MKALLISDSHGRDQYIERAIMKHYPIDRLIHLGDLESSESYLQTIATCPVEIVAGNCDPFSRLPRFKVIPFGRHQIFMTHGHLFDVRTGTERLVREARQMGCDYAFFGHTHIPCCHRHEGFTCVNPGSVSIPKNGTPHSYALLEDGLMRWIDLEHGEFDRQRLWD